MSNETNQNLGEVTLLIRAIQKGEKDKINELIPVAINKIREFAKRQIHKRNVNHDVSATTLIHKLYMNLKKNVNNTETFLKNSINPRSDDFYALCNEIIKNLLYDYFRKFKDKNERTESLDDETKNFAWLSSKNESIETILLVKEALSILKKQGFERQVKVIEYKYICRFTDEEISKILNIAVKTVQSDKLTAERKLFIILNPQVNEIYKKALEIPDEAQRIKFIKEECGEDEKLLKIIRLMLK